MIVVPEFVLAAGVELGAMMHAASMTVGASTSVAAAADDEVPAAVAELFGEFGRHYQQARTQMAALHRRLVQARDAAVQAYEAVSPTTSSW